MILEGAENSASRNRRACRGTITDAPCMLRQPGDRPSAGILFIIEYSSDRRRRPAEARSPDARPYCRGQRMAEFDLPIDRRRLMLGAALVGGSVAFDPAAAASSPPRSKPRTASSLTTPPRSDRCHHLGTCARVQARRHLHLPRTSLRRRCDRGRPVPAGGLLRSPGRVCVRGLGYGPVSPQPRRGYGDDELAFVADWNDGYPGENCLTLNVWSSRPASGRRPSRCSSGSTAAGTPAAHRMSCRAMKAAGSPPRTWSSSASTIGSARSASWTCRTSAATPSPVRAMSACSTSCWRCSGCATISPTSAATRRVTIAGQSGGGGKVSALMAMPAARGLFHRGVVMSGSFPPAKPQAEARAFADAVMTRAQDQGQ